MALDAADIRTAPPQDFLDAGPAACTEHDPELFFPRPGEDGTAAKRVCRHCEIRSGCRAWAIPVRGLVGIWGGLSANERARLRGES